MISSEAKVRILAWMDQNGPVSRDVLASVVGEVLMSMGLREDAKYGHLWVWVLERDGLIEEVDGKLSLTPRGAAMVTLYRFGRAEQ